MIKLLIAPLAIFCSLSAFAALDCNSPNYNYNPNVKQQCEQQNKLTENSRQKLKDNFSQSLMKNQGALKITNPSANVSAPATSSQPPKADVNTSTSSNTTSSTNETTTQQTTTPSSTTPSQTPTAQPTTGSPTKYY